MKTKKIYLHILSAIINGGAIGLICGLSNGGYTSAIAVFSILFLSVSLFLEAEDNMTIITTIMCISLVINLFVGMSLRKKSEMNKQLQEIEIKSYEAKLKMQLIEFEYNLKNGKDTLLLNEIEEIK